MLFRSPPFGKSGDFLANRLPDPWQLFFLAVVNMCCKTTGRGKANLNNLEVMHAIYHDFLDIDVGGIVYEELISVMNLRKASELVCHRFWSEPG